MIHPTIGRKVWYWPGAHDMLGVDPMAREDSDQPFDATVVCVHGPRTVNLRIIDHDGNAFNRLSVTLRQEGDDPPITGPYAEWMPYQLGQTKPQPGPGTAAPTGKVQPFRAVPLGGEVEHVVGTPAVSLTPEFIARVCHEVNKAYCESLGDYSQPSWEDAPQWQKDSALTGVKLHIINPDAGAAASHESWMKQKLDEGWKWGPVKDAEKKEHHCIVPFDALPEAQQAKDYIFRGVVHALMPF